MIAFQGPIFRRHGPKFTDNGIPTVIAGGKNVALSTIDPAKSAKPRRIPSLSSEARRTSHRQGRPGQGQRGQTRPPTSLTKHVSGPVTTRPCAALEEEYPEHTLLWLSTGETQHETGWDRQALAAIETSDKNLGESSGLGDADLNKTGCSSFRTWLPTISAAPTSWWKLKSSPQPRNSRTRNRDVLVGLGGSVLFYVDRTESVIRRLAEFLQTTDFAGVLSRGCPSTARSAETVR